MRVTLEVEGERFDVELQRTEKGVRVECEDARLDLVGEAVDGTVLLVHDGTQRRVEITSDQRATVDNQPVEYFVADFAPGSPVAAAGAHARIPVRAVMHGRLVKVLAQAGQSVQKGEALFVLEAMKMQNELTSPSEGRLTEVVAKPGDVVDVGRVLAWLERAKA